MNRRTRVPTLLVLLLVCGCGAPKAPEIIPVTGSLTINGKPLAKATVKFLPVADGLGGNFTASGVTDEEGKFTLALPGDKGSGCYACETKVLVTEGPLPPGSRDDTAKGDLLARKYTASLKNRPIPQIYRRIGTTPISVVVSADENHFDFELESGE